MYDVGSKSNRKNGPLQQTTTRRGLRICQKDGQIKALGGDRWDVASQSAKNKWYRVSFACDGPTCDCKYYATGRGRRCKHIAAVEQLLSTSSEPAPTEHVVIEEQGVGCPKCKRKDYARDGTCRGRYEDRQLYRCPCGRQFRDNLGVEYRQMPRRFITAILLLYGAGGGVSVANTRALLGHFGISVHVDTVTRNIEPYSIMVEGYTNKIKPPRLGDTWGCDEKRQKVRGRESWIVAAMRAATRFALAWDVSLTKEKYDAAPLLWAAKVMAGWAPRLFITDGLSQYHIAFKKVYHMVRGLMCLHIRDIHIRNKVCSTNTQERLNGEFADQFRSARGINKEDSPIFRSAIIHHNVIKPHGGIGGRTPAEVAGIEIRGQDKWLTLIQNAAAAS